MNDVADQLMPAISRSSSLREIYLGENPWKEQEWKSIINVYQKPSQINILGLGSHTYLVEDCVKVQYLFTESTTADTIFRFQMINRALEVNPELKIIYKGQIKEQPVEEANFKNILVDRIKALAMKPKKKKLRKNMG